MKKWTICTLSSFLAFFLFVPFTSYAQAKPDQETSVSKEAGRAYPVLKKQKNRRMRAFRRKS